ncbi:MAG: PEP-CTERM sorting domain-containing protein [Candidatus Acidiferrales bacterium]
MSNFNPFRLAIGFLTLVLVTAGNAKFARADNVQTFNFSGIVTSFNGSDTVTGTFTLDTTNATITAFDFTTPVVTISATDGWTATVSTYTPALSPNLDFVVLFFGDGDEDVMSLLFTTTLNSFDGNTFFTGPVQPYPGAQTIIGLQCDFLGIKGTSQCSNGLYSSDFASGSATPISSTPEPSSLLLLGIGVVGLAIFQYKRHGSIPVAG